MNEINSSSVRKSNNTKLTTSDTKKAPKWKL